MRKVILFLLLACSLSAGAQKYSVRKRADELSVAVSDSLALRHLYMSGEHLQQSGSLQFGAIGLSLASGLALTLGAEKDNKAMIGVGIASGVGAIVCEFLSISRKMKAGKELKLSAGEIVFRF